MPFPDDFNCNLKIFNDQQIKIFPLYPSPITEFSAVRTLHSSHGVHSTMEDQRPGWATRVDAALETLVECGYSKTVIEALRSEPHFKGGYASLLDADIGECLRVLEQVAQGKKSAKDVMPWAQQEPLRTRRINCTIEDDVRT